MIKLFTFILALGSTSNVVFAIGSESKCDELYRSCKQVSLFMEDYFHNETSRYYQMKSDIENQCSYEKEVCLQEKEQYPRFEQSTLINKTVEHSRSIIESTPNRRLVRAIRNGSIFPNHKWLKDKSGRELRVGKVQNTPLVKKGNSGFCTGTLISPSQVITARHCIEDHNKKVNIDDFEFLTDNGLVAKVIRAKVSEKKFPKFMDDSYIRRVNDFAVLDLDEPLGDKVGYYRLYQGNYKDLLNEKFSMVGYPALQIRRSSLFDRYYAYEFVQQKYILKNECEIAFIVKSLIFSNCAPGGGMSGGPLFHTDKSGEKTIIAILSGTEHRNGYDSSIWVTPLGLNFESDFKVY